MNEAHCGASQTACNLVQHVAGLQTKHCRVCRRSVSGGNMVALLDVPVGARTSRSLDQGQHRTGHQVLSAF